MADAPGSQSTEPTPALTGEHGWWCISNDATGLDGCNCGVAAPTDWRRIATNLAEVLRRVATENHVHGYDHYELFDVCDADSCNAARAALSEYESQEAT